MGEEIAFQNGQISDIQGLVTLTLTLDRVILHTVMHHSSTSAYTPNFIEIEETFCGQTDGRTFETKFKSTRRSRPKKLKLNSDCVSFWHFHPWLLETGFIYSEFRHCLYTYMKMKMANLAYKHNVNSILHSLVQAFEHQSAQQAV